MRAWTCRRSSSLLQDRGAIGLDEMYRAFNMGIGLIVACAADRRTADVVDSCWPRAGEPNAVRDRRAWSAGDPTVRYIGTT